ncbi:HEAT repeat domain-containing protein [Pyxidicoccus sp. MSG2]|uniref:HEAT repeat domain-containing protein n=1 Tax=Pyxidicoccus sp. MSG2 TaxID=2996790 RepID=UPI002270DFAF|nr:HEAT repeat domain-containing protein [Pyxidicoccus sp. MSG2]MCY1017344.1 HEAT repeat domain-containing protein [Pyxidicoccus sp. MSG2]
MSDERPDALLKSALEKIVYFEARAEQLHGELDSTREEMAHLRRELAETGQRELELRREVAELEVRISRMQAEREELTRLNQALRGERHQLMDKLLDASRIRSSAQERAEEDDDLGLDLASFISQLRSEVLLRGEAGPVAHGVVVPAVRGPAVPLRAHAPTGSDSEPPVAATERESEKGREGLSPVAREAQRFFQAGRLGVSAAQHAELSAHAGFGSTTDETLFGFSVRELSAQDAAARVRAAERLKALAQPAAAPALAAALHAETDSSAQVALLQAFASLCREQGASVVSPLLSSPVPEVRIAALKALLTLAPMDAAPHLAQAMKDPDRSVRRRASLLALGLEGETARRLGEEAIHDEDPEARALAALALGAGSGENARTLLLGALADREPRVRKAAAQSLSRILGHDVSAVVALDDTHRRREIRRLATLPIKPVRARLEQPRAVTVAPVLAVAQALVAAVGAPVQVMAAASNGAPVQAMNGQGAVGQPVYAVATVGHAQVGAVAPVQNPRPGSPPPPPQVGAVAPVQNPRPGSPPPPARANPPAPQAPASRLSPVQAALVAMGAVPGQAAAASRAPAEPPAAPGRPTASPVEALCSKMLAEVRAAVRGRSLVELALSLSAPSELAQEALTLLSARGAVVRRGHKYFAA